MEVIQIMQINPEVKNIRQLLNSKKQFVIPRFQREYSWEKKNYEEFISDIVSGLKIDADGEIVSDKYFLGTMLFIGIRYDVGDKQGYLEATVEYALRRFKG